MRTVLLICLVALLSESTITAQTHADQFLARRPTPNQRETESKRESQQATDSVKLQLKSESTALAWSLWGTLAPLPTIVLIVPGLIVGPSLGYFYAGMSGRALIGIGIRTVAVGGIIAVIGFGLSDNVSGGDEPYLALLGIGSTITLIVDLVHDISNVKSSVRTQNAKLQQSGWKVTPKYFVESKSVGLNLSYSF